MRRIDALAIGLGVLLAGGLLFAAFRAFGIDGTNAGIWTQAALALGLLVWIASYGWRAVSGKMTYHQQRKDYEDAVLQKRLEELTPAELAKLQAEIESERQASERSR